MSIETDKCTEIFTIRIPEILKNDLDKLTKHQKSELIQDILIAMAQSVHKAKFNPELYLKSDNDHNQ